jgi:citrate lyase synthetase
MELRSFLPQDALAVSDLIRTNLHTYYANSWDLEYYCKMYESKQLIQVAQKIDMYVVESGGEIVAAGSLDGNEIKAMFVLNSLQSKGIGKWLILQLENILKSKKYTKSVVLSGKHAVGFYEKMGYTQTGKVFSKGEEIEMEKYF